MKYAMLVNLEPNQGKPSKWNLTKQNIQYFEWMPLDQGIGIMSKYDLWSIVEQTNETSMNHMNRNLECTHKWMIGP